MPFIQETLRSLVGRMEIRTTVGNITIDDPFAPGGGAGASGVVAGFLKPKIVVYPQGGSEPLFSTAPYGEPVNRGTLLTLGGIALLGLVAVHALRR